MRKAAIKHLIFPFTVDISTHVMETEAFFYSFTEPVTEIIKNLPDLNCIVLANSQ